MEWEDVLKESPHAENLEQSGRGVPFAQDKAITPRRLRRFGIDFEDAEIGSDQDIDTRKA
jgi:hypothetical protein